jgi:hypothetical protein
MISGQTPRVCPEGKPGPPSDQVRGHAFPDHALAFYSQHAVALSDERQRRAGWQQSTAVLRISLTVPQPR